MSSSHERNDRRAGFAPRLDPLGGRRFHGRPKAAEAGVEWVWGRHAVAAALANPARAPLRRLVATAEALKALQSEPGGRVALAASGLVPEPAANAGEVARLLPQGAVHQGLALAAQPLEPADLDALADPAEGVLVMLDGVTDPQNVGAIFRSAAAFGARGVILQDRHAPAFSGTLAKAAAGALERLPAARVVNLARTLERLSDLGWRTVGLSGTADLDLAEVLDARPTVLVLGSEGEGLRRLVGEHCDALGRIPMPGGFESLNVSAAAAVALYQAARSRAPGE